MLPRASHRLGIRQLHGGDGRIRHGRGDPLRTSCRHRLRPDESRPVLPRGKHHPHGVRLGRRAHDGACRRNGDGACASHRHNRISGTRAHRPFTIPHSRDYRRMEGAQIALEACPSRGFGVHPSVAGRGIHAILRTSQHNRGDLRNGRPRLCREQKRARPPSPALGVAALRVCRGVSRPERSRARRP